MGLGTRQIAAASARPLAAPDNTFANAAQCGCACVKEITPKIQKATTQANREHVHLQASAVASVQHPQDGVHAQHALPAHTIALQDRFRAPQQRPPGPRLHRGGEKGLSTYSSNAASRVSTLLGLIICVRVGFVFRFGSGGLTHLQRGCPVHSLHRQGQQGEPGAEMRQGLVVPSGRV